MWMMGREDPWMVRGQPQMGRRDGKRPTGDHAHGAQAKKVKYMSCY
jgi:hypothetical protein